jgi:hypothetical protein
VSRRGKPYVRLMPAATPEAAELSAEEPPGSVQSTPSRQLVA